MVEKQTGMMLEEQKASHPHLQTADREMKLGLGGELGSAFELSKSVTSLL